MVGRSPHVQADFVEKGVVARLHPRFSQRIGRVVNLSDQQAIAFLGIKHVALDQEMFD
jgi:hypothetical protein